MNQNKQRNNNNNCGTGVPMASKSHGKSHAILFSLISLEKLNFVEMTELMEIYSRPLAFYKIKGKNTPCNHCCTIYSLIKFGKEMAIT